MKPTYPSNIKSSVYLGPYKDGRAYDLYFCEQYGLRILIARFGSKQFEFHCTKVCSESKLPSLKEAEIRARARGLFDNQSSLAV